MELNIQALLDEQLSSWDMARNNYAALQQVRTKELDVNGCLYKVQFNPARIVSSAAKVDTLSIRERACFLCPENRPAQQKGIPFKEYEILVNPFPIFPKHLTIPASAHTPQWLFLRLADLIDLAACVDEYTIFYNGPKCGASAPDHLHFQAGSKGFLPIEREWRHKIAGKVATCGKSTLWYLDDAPRATLVIESGRREDAIDLLDLVYRAMEVLPGENEPMMNLLAWTEDDQWVICIFPRTKHRPDCYSAEGDANILISPAAVDMGGVFITPLEKDFEKVTATDIASILEEVCLSPAEFEQLREWITMQL